MANKVNLLIYRRPSQHMDPFVFQKSNLANTFLCHSGRIGFGLDPDLLGYEMGLGQVVLGSIQVHV